MFCKLTFNCFLKSVILENISAGEMDYRSLKTKYKIMVYHIVENTEVCINSDSLIRYFESLLLPGHPGKYRFYDPMILHCSKIDLENRLVSLAKVETAHITYPEFIERIRGLLDNFSVSGKYIKLFSPKSLETFITDLNELPDAKYYDFKPKPAVLHAKESAPDKSFWSKERLMTLPKETLVDAIITIVEQLRTFEDGKKGTATDVRENR